MREIKLTKGQFALVDDEDYDMVNMYKWYATKRKGLFYAVADLKTGVRMYKRTYMHRLILGLSDSKQHSDHIDHNGLNNQRFNLRIATRFQNNANKTSHKNSTSKYLGVSWHKGAEKWVSVITKNKKYIYLGVFETEHLAATAYNKAAIELHGEFANLNKV